MTAATGHIELDRTVESIQVGRRHRHDLGDLDALAASIDRDGLLQPITITPDGLLVCGVRRLAAIRQLGWRTVNVWVRSSISDRLGHLLAEQDDNQLHKTLSPLEAAGLYREIKSLMAEDAARREAAGQFTSDYQPRWNGSAESAEPFATPAGDTRRQAAQMVTGANSYTRLEQIGYLQHLATDPDTPEPLRTEAQAGLAQIEAGGPVDPV
nr:ParB N-terminal domain-containing protein [Propionicimonas sp.]